MSATDNSSNQLEFAMEAIVFQVAIFWRTFRTEFFKDTAMKEISVDSEENGRNRSNVSISSMFKATCNYAGSLKHGSDLCIKSMQQKLFKIIFKSYIKLHQQ